MPLFLVCLIWLLINVWKFLVKQGRYRVLPLVTFYVLAISITLVKIYIACQFAAVMVDFQVFAQLICQTLMFTLILQQSWVNIELCYGIVHNRKQINAESPVFPRQRIMKARIIVTTFVTVFATINIICFFVLGQTRDLEQRAYVIIDGFKYYVFTMEVIACVIMTASIVVLKIELSKLGSYLESQKEVFKRERC